MPTPLQAVHLLRRRLLIHRRGLLALCVAVLAWSAVNAVRPPAPPSATVWTAVRDLPSGTVLQREDLQARTVPRSAAPRAAHDLRSLAGRVLAVPVGSGEAATATHLMGNGQLTGYPGRSAVPLRVPDADAVGLLRAGDRVDLVASDPQQPRRAGVRIAADAVVVALPSSTGPEGRLVVFAIPSTDVLEVTGAAAGMFLNVVWNR